MANLTGVKLTKYLCRLCICVIYITKSVLATFVKSRVAKADLDIDNGGMLLTKLNLSTQKSM